MQSFDNFEKAALLSDVLSFVMNAPVDTTIDGDSWIVHSEVSLPVALYLLVDMDLTHDLIRWRGAMLAWEAWRSNYAGTSEYRKVGREAWELRESLIMKNSKLYISPETLDRWKEAEEEERLIKLLVSDPNFREDCENQIRLGHSWRDGSWEWDDSGD